MRLPRLQFGLRTLFWLPLIVGIVLWVRTRQEECDSLAFKHRNKGELLYRYLARRNRPDANQLDQLAKWHFGAAEEYGRVAQFPFQPVLLSPKPDYPEPRRVNDGRR